MSERKSNTTFKPLAGNRFRFRCHKEIRCFTRCCADLNLVLTPYDLVRMKRRLGISSSDFLDKYTNTTIDSHPRFPMVKLKMSQDKKRTCPFVTSNGCTIYEDRPAACRIYPGSAALIGETDEVRIWKAVFQFWQFWTLTIIQVQHVRL